MNADNDQGIYTEGDISLIQHDDDTVSVMVDGKEVEVIDLADVATMEQAEEFVAEFRNRK